MKELPGELWTMVALELKREPPPVGVAANWNDHFHQQDLVNLMRVDQVSSDQLNVLQPLLSFGA